MSLLRSLGTFRLFFSPSRSLPRWTRRSVWSWRSTRGLARRGSRSGGSGPSSRASLYRAPTPPRASLRSAQAPSASRARRLPPTARADACTMGTRRCARGARCCCTRWISSLFSPPPRPMPPSSSATSATARAAGSARARASNSTCGSRRHHAAMHRSTRWTTTAARTPSRRPTRRRISANALTRRRTRARRREPRAPRTTARGRGRRRALRWRRRRRAAARRVLLAWRAPNPAAASARAACRARINSQGAGAPRIIPLIAMP